MAKTLPAIILILAVVYGGVQGAVFTKCDSPSGDFTKVTVSGCGDEQAECILQRNTVVNITIDFDSKVNTGALTTVVHGTIAGMDMPFPMSQPDACKSGVSCPVTSGSSYEYEASLPILKAYPKIKVVVKWELQDENGKDVVCVHIPARIK